MCRSISTHGLGAGLGWSTRGAWDITCRSGLRCGSRDIRSQRLIARSESLDDWMSREPHLKPLRQVISHAPRVLHANPTPRPGVEILRHILAKKERRIEESHESAKPSLAERPQLDRPPDHVARKRAAL